MESTFLRMADNKEFVGRVWVVIHACEAGDYKVYFPSLTIMLSLLEGMLLSSVECLVLCNMNS